MYQDLDLSRRDFVLAGATTVLAAPTNVQAQQASQDAAYRTVPVLVGESTHRPEPGGEFFDGLTYYGFLYRATDTGTLTYIETGDDTWTYLARQPVTETYTGDGTTTGREITLGFEPQWFEIHRDDSSNAEVHEGVGVGGNHSMRTVGGALTMDIDRSTAVYTSSNGVMVGDGDTHVNTDGATYILFAVP